MRSVEATKIINLLRHLGWMCIPSDGVGPAQALFDGGPIDVVAPGEAVNAGIPVVTLPSDAARFDVVAFTAIRRIGGGIRLAFSQSDDAGRHAIALTSVRTSAREFIKALRAEVQEAELGN